MGAFARSGPWRPAVVFWIALAAPAAFAQAPGLAEDLVFEDGATLSWQPATAAASHNVYRGRVGELPLGQGARCHGYRLGEATFSTPSAPSPGDAYYYLVTGESASSVEGSPGLDSAGFRRVLLGACKPVMRNHVLNRIGYGWGEWSAANLELVGPEAYVAAQLSPTSIVETDNALLTAQLAAITPPGTSLGLIQQQVLRGTYSRRQLQQKMVAFWANHFNTEWTKINVYYQQLFPKCDAPGVPPQCDPTFPLRSFNVAAAHQYDETEAFRRTAFDGTFRDLLEDSALSPAMVIYLDTYTSIAGNPNENYPRELMELHSLGVDGGYTQLDVAELSRVITGWSVCAKLSGDAGDPLAPCTPDYWNEDPPRRFVATFDSALHDCTAKTLFLGTPQEVTIPDTCADPEAGLDDLFLALDAIAAHPSTARFISEKLLELLVTDAPTGEMVDAVVAAWNDPSNPRGVGDLRAVLAAVLDPEWFLDPDLVRTKVKTPLEQALSALRATRARSDGATGVIGFLDAAQHKPYSNPTPTGWPEDGPSWIDTTGTLERQKFAWSLMTSTDPDFIPEAIALLEDNGISTAPGNAEAIVEFFSRVLFGGALRPAERQRAIDFLNTDAEGRPSPYDASRILRTVALLLGYPQFQEQ